MIEEAQSEERGPTLAPERALARAREPSRWGWTRTRELNANKCLCFVARQKFEDGVVPSNRHLTGACNSAGPLFVGPKRPNFLVFPGFRRQPVGSRKPALRLRNRYRRCASSQLTASRSLAPTTSV